MPSEREYHRALAVSLMKSIGFDDAIDCALRNQWQGVLAQLHGLAKFPRPPDPDDQGAKAP
ncbi:MAG: hypothetical protein IH994_11140 [Proteobacteria bacterium]|nr:hypothetical protein [Pseudomonadota bacterium]